MVLLVSGRFTALLGAASLRVRLYNYQTGGWAAFDDVSLIALSGDGTITCEYYYVADTRIAVRENDVLYFLFGDHLGSQTIVANSSGALVAETRYKAYGEQRYTTNATPTTYGYTGQRLDSTGLLYYHARMYDPVLGRFISADSVVPGSASGGIDGVALKPRDGVCIGPE